MTTKKTRIAIGAVVIGVFAFAVALVVSVDFRSPELGQTALEKASKASGMKLRATGFRLNLLRGLVLEDVEATWRFPGGRFEVRVDEMVFEHRLLPLLSGKVVIERVVVKRPRLNLVDIPRRPPSKGAVTGTKDRSSAAPERQPPSTQSTGRHLVLEVSELRLEDGAIADSRDNGSGTPSVKGIDCVLRHLDFHSGALSPLHGLSAEGDLQVKEFALESSLVLDFKGRLEADRGRLSLHEIGFVAHGGAFRGTMTMDFNRFPFTYTFSLKGGPLDVGAWTGAEDRGRLGHGFLELEAEGFGMSSKAIKGKGKLTLESGTLPSTPIFDLIAEILGWNTWVGSTYRATEAVFRIERNELYLEPFRVEADDVGLDLSGSVDLDGPLALSFMVRVPREGLGIPDRVLDTLATEQGLVVIPFQVTGTVEDPVVRLDTEALNLQ